MNHVEQFRTSLLVKEASPRWAKMMAQGKLSPQSILRLKDGLSGGTRQIGNRALGSGAEGKMMPSFTPGIGDTSTKVFYDLPHVSDKFGKMMTGPRGRQERMIPKRITGGDTGILDMLGGGNIDDRVAIMRHYPDFFPKIFGQHARGFHTERLKDIPRIGSSLGQFTDDTANLAKDLTHYKNLLAPYTTPRRTMVDRLFRRPGKAPGVPENWRSAQDHVKNLEVELATRQKMKMDYLRGRHDSDKLLNAMERRTMHQTGHVGQDSYGQPIYRLRLPNGQLREVRDFNIANHQPRNIMQTQQGRAVVSDPVIEMNGANARFPQRPAQPLPQRPAPKIYESPFQAMSTVR